MSRKKKSFARYFKKTFKQNIFLLFKYLLSSILYIIISVLSNLLAVKELTYLNAFLVIGYFSTMIAFGVSTGIRIMVSQSISSHAKVEKYIKIGFEITLLISTIATILLALFPSFFMETIGGYMPDDYTFYYIMCAYFFLTCLFEYMASMIKEFKLMKINMLAYILPLIITVLGFFILYFAGIYYLNLIAIIYVISALFGVIYSYFALLKNKKIKINILKFNFSKLTSKQWIIILNNFAIQIIWEVGYYATSVFLLRMSDSVFNTYSYLENVLDVFNGVLFTFITVTSIKIGRALGKNQFEEAYKHAKYSIYATLIIWAFYFVCSMVLIYPIALGVNKAYFDIMFLVIPCYTIIHLLRFLTWNFSSYMLSLGGKTTLLLITEIISTIYLVTLCFITSFIPNNIILIYFLITLPDFITLPIFIIIFKRKKWLANINEDPKLLSNQIKVVIFDFDDTLYFGVDWKFWKEEYIAFFENHFSYLSADEKKNLIKKHLNRDYIKNSTDIIKILIAEEGSAKAWLDFRDSISGELSEEEKKGNIVPQEEMQEFYNQAKRLNGKLYIVSNSTLKDIKAFAEFYNIDLSIFEKIYTNDYDISDITKERYYKEIIAENNITPSEAMVIGDSYANDILPAKKLKMHYYQCENGFTYEEVVN